MRLYNEYNESVLVVWKWRCDDTTIMTENSEESYNVQDSEDSDDEDNVSDEDEPIANTLDVIPSSRKLTNL